MNKIFKCFLVLVLLCALVLPFVSCKNKSAQINLPEEISMTSDKSQPLLKVFNVDTKTIEEMDLETYLEGVLAGEMFSDWPLEALKAQAILARTYTLHFLKNKQSKYDGADISNDISEAQAYNKELVNDNIKQALAETKGLVVLSGDNLIEAWFHSNSGGATTRAQYGLNYLEEETYTKFVASPENKDNSDNFVWSETFSKSEILSALREMGISVSTISSMEISSTDESGRVLKFMIGDTEVDGNTFRIKIGSTKMKSTKIDDLVVSTSSVYMSGTGYGHGVGMSQWGAKILAEQGKTAEEIIQYYFDNIQINQAKY